MLSDATKRYRIQVRQRGQVTIPRRLRDSLSIDEGDTLTAVAVGDMLVLVPRPLYTPELTDQIAAMIEARGLTLSDMLEDLPRIREELYQERYGSRENEVE